MLGLYVSVPIASFRRGAAREFWETYPLPPPSTVYGFLLSFVGETDRHRHVGARCTAGLIGEPETSTVLRQFWRMKEAKAGIGRGVNVRPDFQQILSDVRLVVWLDSSDEDQGDAATLTLEQRVQIALNPKERAVVSRFGGLCLGESTHLVDEVSRLVVESHISGEPLQMYLAEGTGNLPLPVWVDHVGSIGTRYVNGRLVKSDGSPPDVDQLPRIETTESVVSK